MLRHLIKILKTLVFAYIFYNDDTSLKLALRIISRRSFMDSTSVITVVFGSSGVAFVICDT